MMKSGAIVKGSLSDIATQTGGSLAEAFTGADCVILVDTSGSMGCHNQNGMTRYEQACDELRQLQESMPGKIAVVSFSSQNEVMFNPGGEPWNFGGCTDLAGALRFAKIADVPGIRFIVISDGKPDSPSDALRVAGQFRSRIDVIYTGPEEFPTGRNFLQRLAAASGGVTVTAAEAMKLADSTQQLLLATA